MKNFKIWKPGLQHSSVFVAFVSVFVALQTAYAMIIIPGTVTARRADSVKVEFKPHKTAGANEGDKVDFETMIQGIKVNAGQGKVTEIGINYAWVKITKGRPNLKMTGIIQATGKPLDLEIVLQKAYNTLTKGKDANSLSLLEKYVNQGKSEAQYYLGRLYQEGYGVIEDNKKAMQLFQLAVAQEHAYSKISLGWGYMYGVGVEKDKKKAAQLFRSLADEGDSGGQGPLGFCYIFGHGVERYCDKGLYYLELGVKGGDRTSINILGRIYTDGECVDKDLDKGLSLLKRAVELGQVYAMANLAQHYEKGWVVEKDIEKAIYWYKKSGTTWAEEALDRLGASY